MKPIRRVRRCTPRHMSSAAKTRSAGSNTAANTPRFHASLELRSNRVATSSTSTRASPGPPNTFMRVMTSAT